MANKANEVIENLIRQIESGTAPWQCGWEKSGSCLPTNSATGQVTSPGLTGRSVRSSELMPTLSRNWWRKCHAPLPKRGLVLKVKSLTMQVISKHG